MTEKENLDFTKRVMNYNKNYKQATDEQKKLEEQQDIIMKETDYLIAWNQLVHTYNIFISFCRSEQLDKIFFAPDYPENLLLIDGSLTLRDSLAKYDSNKDLFQAIDSNFNYEKYKDLSDNLIAALIEFLMLYKAKVKSYESLCDFAELCLMYEMPKFFNENPLVMIDGNICIYNNQTKYHELVTKDIFISVIKEFSNMSDIDYKRLIKAILCSLRLPCCCVRIKKDSVHIPNGYCPDYLSKILYYMTGGKTEKINALSELSAYMLTDGISKKHFVIYCDEKVNPYLKVFFQCLTYRPHVVVFDDKDVKTRVHYYDIDAPSYQFIDYSFDKTYTNNGIETLINAKLSGKYANIVFNSKLPKDKNAIKNFKKLIQAKKPYIANGFTGKISLMNTLPFIYISNDFEKKNPALTDFEPIYLDSVDNSLYDEVSVFPKEPLESGWLQYPFALYGLKLINDNEIQPKTSPKDLTEEEKVKAFIANCCSFKKDVPCIKESLFGYFKKYIDRLSWTWGYAQNKFTSIVCELYPDLERDITLYVKPENTVQAFMNEQTEPFKSDFIDDSEYIGKRKKAILGIHLDTNKYLSFIQNSQESERSDDSLSFDEFVDYLKYMADIHNRG